MGVLALEVNAVHIAFTPRVLALNPGAQATVSPALLQDSTGLRHAAPSDNWEGTGPSPEQEAVGPGEGGWF